MKWNEKLPDVNQWQPSSNRARSLREGLKLSCRAAQRRIVSEAETERWFNINNFDSGVGVEDIVRQELSRLVPERYSVDAGVVNDPVGRTAGDFEILIRDNRWAPATKLGATPGSRRVHFPVESIYSAIEVKQTLGFQELDNAMEKLVKLSRLDRSENPYGHITENQHISNLDKDFQILNPLHTAILGTRIDEGLTFQELAKRFGEINSALRRSEMVTALCLLAHGVAFYFAQEDGAQLTQATFMWDRQKPLVMGTYEDDPMNTFHQFFVHLLGHLTRSVLAVHDLHRRYGSFQPTTVFKLWPNARYNLA